MLDSVRHSLPAGVIIHNYMFGVFDGISASRLVCFLANFCIFPQNVLCYLHQILSAVLGDVILQAVCQLFCDLKTESLVCKFIMMTIFYCQVFIPCLSKSQIFQIVCRYTVPFP